jgi:hypothetical protein
MKHRERHVDLSGASLDEEAPPGHLEEHPRAFGRQGSATRIRQVPDAVAGDSDRHDLMTAALESLEGGNRRNTRHLMLFGTTPEEEGNSSHG